MTLVSGLQTICPSLSIITEVFPILYVQAGKLSVEERLVNTSTCYSSTLIYRGWYNI